MVVELTKTKHIDLRPIIWATCLAMPLIGANAAAVTARAQDANLLLVPPPPDAKNENPSDQLYHALHNSSFLYRKLPPEMELRELQINDIITVLVDYRATMTSEGDAESRKNVNYNAILADWITFDGKDIFRAPQRRGSPAINASLNSQYRTESDMELRDMMTFRIAAAVVDIRPNGNLVIEARREVRNNDEVWLQSLTGVVRRQSIGPDRTVRSDEIAELRIDKQERGFIRDSYKRGWFKLLYDKWKAI